MRKLLLTLAAALIATASQAQLFTADFEALPLAGNDTFYINTANPMTDAGFDNSVLHFPYMYDTSFGGMWAGGFSYSKVRDSVKSGFMNQYAAKPASGALGSAKYIVYNPGFGAAPAIRLINRQKFVPQAAYLTNSTYTYNSMHDGDQFSKKFGGVSGNDSDYFLLTIYGWANGQRKADSVNFFLADFRSPNNALDYLVRDWRLVNLSPLGMVDSLTFDFISSDVGQFGMNTPAYFCMDNLTIGIPAAGVPEVQTLAKAYPNPVTNVLNVELFDNSVRGARVLDMSGRVIGSYAAQNGRMQIPTGSLTPGVYLLQLEANGRPATMRFVKQ